MMDKMEMTINKVNAYISKINKEAYKSVYLLSNEVLSRNTNSNEFFSKLYHNEEPERVTIRHVLRNICIYYKRNFSHFYWYIRKYIAYKKVFKKKPYNFSNDVFLIDNYMVIDNILKQKKYKDYYFDGLDEIMKLENYNYIYISCFVEGSNPSLLKMENFFKILKEDKNNYLFDFDLFSFFDVIKIFNFILFYPFFVLRLKFILQEEKIDKLFWFELIESLKNNVSFFKYNRYLFGKKIDTYLPNKKIVISWFENQAIHKNLYKGINSSRSNTYILGTQLFVYSKNYYMFKILDIEKSFGIVPDKIIVNGKYYADNKYEIGPSFRYKKVFSNKSLPKQINQYDCVVFLSYVEKYNTFILNMLNQEFFINKKIAFKCHPAKEAVVSFSSENWCRVDTDIYDLMNNTDIIISNESGTLIEAVTQSKMVIVIRNMQDASAGFLVEYGKSKIWDEAFNKVGVKKLYNQFVKYKEENSSELYEIASWYKEWFFKEPTKSNIIEILELAKEGKK